MSDSRTKSVVPRGFSRFYVLYLLKEKSMTGKEIMDETAKRSNGGWKPSPGLVYPLLGKLLAQGLIMENPAGGYTITPEGAKALEEYEVTNPGFEQLLVPFMQLGVYGKIVAQDFTDQVIGAMKSIRDNISKATSSGREKYREFLRSELERMEREDKSRTEKAAPAPAV